MPVLDWIPPPDPDPWDLDLGHLGLSRRAYRLLRLQGFHTVRAIALAIHTGALDFYPPWLREDLEPCFARLRPILVDASQRARAVSAARTARIQALDWSTTVIGRALSREEMAALAALDIRDLSCDYPSRQAPAACGAWNLLDAALLGRPQALAVPGCGDARIDRLRLAIEGALAGNVDRRWSAPPDYEAPGCTLGGRPLTLEEVVDLQHRSIRAIPFSARACRIAAALGLDTWLDLAATPRRDLLFAPSCGRVTTTELATAIRERLDGIARPTTAPAPCSTGVPRSVS